MNLGGHRHILWSSHNNKHKNEIDDVMDCVWLNKKIHFAKWKTDHPSSPVKFTPLTHHDDDLPFFWSKTMSRNNIVFIDLIWKFFRKKNGPRCFCASRHLHFDVISSLHYRHNMLFIFVSCQSNLFKNFSDQAQCRSSPVSFHSFGLVDRSIDRRRRRRCSLWSTVHLFRFCFLYLKVKVNIEWRWFCRVYPTRPVCHSSFSSLFLLLSSRFTTTKKYSFAIRFALFIMSR